MHPKTFTLAETYVMGKTIFFLSLSQCEFRPIAQSLVKTYISIFFIQLNQLVKLADQLYQPSISFCSSFSFISSRIFLPIFFL